MPNSSSKIAKEINDAYFTDPKVCEWCYTVVGELAGWDFKGTALEPSVGAGAFVSASSSLGLDLEWVTNDPFPQPSYPPDFVEDFRTFDHGRWDYVITNPAFGINNTFAKFTMKKALTIADRVMCVLPKGARRIGFRDAMPRNAKCVVDVDLPDETYTLPNGETRSVKTCLMAYEVVSGANFPKIKSTLDLRDDLFDYWGGQDNHKHGDFDVQVTRWGRMGLVIKKENARNSGSLMSVRLKGISLEDFISVSEALDFSDYKGMSTAADAFDVPAWVDRFNREAVRRGLLDPV